MYLQLDSIHQFRIILPRVYARYMNSKDSRLFSPPFPYFSQSHTPVWLSLSLRS